MCYCETNATISPTKELAYRVNKILDFLDICQSTILIDDLSNNKIIKAKKRNTHFLSKTPYFQPTFQIYSYTLNNRNFSECSIFNTLKLHNKKLKKIAELLLKYPMFYATPQFDAGKVESPLHLRLKPDSCFKKH